tara:strand:+ start:174 stop:635 length:462 start_codon:yes stop_codon:yes gene_type:complete
MPSIAWKGDNLSERKQLKSWIDGISNVDVYFNNNILPLYKNELERKKVQDNFNTLKEQYKDLSNFEKNKKIVKELYTSASDKKVPGMYYMIYGDKDGRYTIHSDRMFGVNKSGRNIPSSRISQGRVSNKNTSKRKGGTKRKKLGNTKRKNTRK